ncbi:hypothetical protein GCM10009643_28440 [Microbacterium aurantiacum]
MPSLPPVEQAVLLEAFVESRERERLDEIVRRPQADRLAHHVRVAHRRDGDDVDLRPVGSEVREHVQTGAVRHRHVQEDEVDAVPRCVLEHGGDRRARTGAFGDDLEPFDAVDVSAVQLQRQSLVIHQHLTLSGGRGEQADGLLRPAELQERDGGVHAIAVLVRLRTERLPEGAHRRGGGEGVAHGARRKVAGDAPCRAAGESGSPEARGDEPCRDPDGHEDAGHDG